AEQGHPATGAPSELDLLVPGEEPKAQLDDRSRVGGSWHGVRAELDLAAVEPLPDLEISLPGLDVSLERAVIPEEDMRLAAVFAACVLAGAAHPHAGIDADAEQVQDQQHLALFQRHAWVVPRLHEG